VVPRRKLRTQAVTALALLAGPLTALGVASCATGTGFGETTSGSSSSSTSATSTSTSSSTTSASSSSGGGAGGSGGAATSSSSTTSSTTSSSSGAGGSGGAGGAPVDAGSDAGDAGDSGGGGAPSGVVVMLAAGSATLLAGEFHPGVGWNTTTLADGSNDGTAVALTGPAAGLGVIRSVSAAGELRFTSFTPGAWTAPAPVAAGVTTRAAPALGASGATVDLTFHGDNFKHYFGAHLAAWSPVAEAVGGTANQSYGPSPATITALGSDAVVAFAGNNNDLFDQTRTGGAWQPAHAHNLGAQVTVSPAIVTLGANPDLLIAYVRSTDAHIVYTTRTGAVWTNPAPIDPSALSNDPVALAALPGGGAVLVYRGQNGKIYWSRYLTGAIPPWTPAAGIDATNYATPSTPSVAPGVGGADAEMVFIDAATGAARHARLTGSAWSPPVTIGGTTLAHVSAASNPL
jgi:hypothetical protein